MLLTQKLQQEQISPLEQVHIDCGGIKVRDSFVQGPSLETSSLSQLCVAEPQLNCIEETDR